MSKLMAAAAYAAEKHAFQVRKGRDGAPYVNHVLDVARRLEAAHPDDAVLVIAGLLHDVIEDCADWKRDDPHRTPEALGRDIEGRFGAEVAALVWEVTDDPAWTDLPRVKRKALQADHLVHASRPAKKLKIADQTSNLNDIAREPGAWERSDALSYINAATRVVAACRDVDDGLAAQFDLAREAALTAIGEAP